MQLEHDFGAIQRAADYRVLRGKLHGPAITSLIVGALLVLIGIGVGDKLIILVLSVVGGLCLAKGIWNLFAVSPIALLVQGVSIFLLSLFLLIFLTANVVSLVFSLLDSADTTHRSVYFIYVIASAACTVVIVWRGISYIRAYKRFARKKVRAPSHEVADELDRILEDLDRSLFREDNQIILMEYGPCSGKARLAADAACFVFDRAPPLVRTEDIVFIKKENFDYTFASEPTRSGATAVLLLLESACFNVRMEQESLARLRAWKRKG